MAAAVGRHGGRPLRNGRFRGRHESGEDGLKLDYSKEPIENLRDILKNTVSQSGVNKARTLAYLNALVKLLFKYGNDQFPGISKRDILCCLRISLFHEAKEVRAATLRVLRYFLEDSDTLDLLYSLHIDYLIVRSIDLCLDNEVERIHAIKLIRKIAHVAPKKLSALLLYPLVAIGNDGVNERDRMVRISLETICEIAFLNPDLLARCGGISAILRAALDCHQYPRINESLVSTVLHLINHPRTRHLIKFNTDLEQLLAPFTDCHYRFSADTSDHFSGEVRENLFAASKMAIISIMRSWPGIIRFCRPDGSGLQSLVGILYLPYVDIRQGILDILYDLFRLKIPETTDDFNTAILSVDPSEMNENWKVTDGFVAAEGRTLLPHMAKIRPNLVENHLALLLSAWIGAGILEALVEVIISSESCLFIKATTLLGEFLHLASTLLPHECSHHSHCLPSLVALASSSDISTVQRHQASIAVYYLDRLHSMKKRGPVPSSLYLDQLIQKNGGRNIGQTKFHLRKKYDIYITKSPSEDMVGQAIKDSQVLSTKESLHWDWDLIPAILMWPEEKVRKLDDQNYVRFIKRLVYFFKPTNHKFSRIEIADKLSQKMAHAGCLLVSFLLESDQEEAQKQINDFLNDIGQCLSEISNQCLAPEAVLSPANVINTCSQYYFLFVGRFSCTSKGDKYLEKTGIFQYLLEIVTVATQDSFVKLTVSSLNYSRDSNTRPILAKALTGSTESSRLYCTKFLRVLLRARVAGFSSWGMELLVNQLYDQSKQVANTALSVVEEACDVEACLSTIIKLRPTCLHLGEKGVLLVCRFMGTLKGFKMLHDANYIQNELQKWEKTYNVRYVHIVEELLNEALTTYEKTYEGSYTRRSSRRRPKKDVYVPVHLYGQLSQHQEGLELVRSQECVDEYFQCIRCQELFSDEDILRMKTALWAVGHIGTSTWGVNWLEEERLLPEVIKLAEESGVFSIRGTAFYILGLLASTREGTEYLAQLGWESCWHTREERWPVVEDRTELLTEIEDFTSDTFSYRSESDSKGYHSPGIVSSSLFFIAEEEKSSSVENGCDTNLIKSCDKNSNFDTSVFIPKKAMPGIIGRSKTLPLESSSYRRYKTLPSRPSNIRSYSVGHTDREKMAKDSDKKMIRSEHRTLKIDDQKEKSNENKDNSEVDPVGGKDTESAEDQRIPVIRLSDIDSRNDKNDDVDTKTRDKVEPNTYDSFPTDDQESEGITFSVRGDDSSSSKIDSLEKKTVTDHYLKKSPNMKDGRSSSSDSSRTSNKSRTDSFNTESTTSGVSSCESGPHTCLSSEVMSLSPIASTGSVDTVGLSQKGTEVRDLVHPSSFRRKSLNLKRVPSLRKTQANPAFGILPSARLSEGLSNESAIIYTSKQEALGYATWMSIKRQRRISSDVESDLGLANLYGEEEEMIVPASRRSSIDSKMSTETYTFRLSSGIPRNASSVSVSEQERPSSPFGVAPKSILQQRRPHTGVAEFLGLCLPVDINMIFEVHEGEDKRSHSIKGIFSKQDSLPEFKKPASRSRKSSRTTSVSAATDSVDHDSTICLICDKKTPNAEGSQPYPDDPNYQDAESESDGVIVERNAGSLSAAFKGSTRTRLDSLNEPSSATPGSMTSCTSNDSHTMKMSYDNVHGRALIRKELRKLVISLSSSVGAKGSEQGLLMLKQKFPLVFRDICFYSEVCHIMSTCSFRLLARRFVQELFEEFAFKMLLEEPYLLLGVTESAETLKSSPGKPESLDSVWENNF